MVEQFVGNSPWKMPNGNPKLDFDSLLRYSEVCSGLRRFLTVCVVAMVSAFQGGP
jgi:hypothetical protein